jgi:putative membrane protein
MQENQFKKIIYTLSIVIPIVVVFLFSFHLEGYDTTFLPPIYATTNGITALVLIGALVAIKNKNIKLHQKLIKVALGLSVLFLALYVARHITSSEIIFGDLDGDGLLDDNEKSVLGVSRFVYYFILITHIALSVIVIPLVLFAFMRGTLNQIQKHKKIVRFAFPVWLYVAITGVIVYLMIYPYY